VPKRSSRFGFRIRADVSIGALSHRVGLLDVAYIAMQINLIKEAGQLEPVSGAKRAHFA
jgi:hypothetical protein